MLSRSGTITSRLRPPLHTPVCSFIFRFAVVVTVVPLKNLFTQRSRELSTPAHSNMGAAKLHLSLLLLGLLRGPG
jgi:hypothetical protein